MKVTTASRRLAALGAAAWLVSAALAQTPSPPPTAAEILDRYVQVTGGADAYRKIHSRYTAGTTELVGHGIKGPVRVWQSAPANMLTEIDLGGAGSSRQGSDGEILWETGLAGPRILEGAERAAMLRLSAFNAELRRLGLDAIVVKQPVVF